MANKMADKKKNASQEQLVAPKPKPRNSNVDTEAGKTVKPVTRERKVQESKSVRRDTKKPSLLMRMRGNRFARFVLDSYYELRHKVTWPTFVEARNMTVIVILLSAAVGAVIAAVDYGLFALFKLLSGI
ncbi:MAG: preprotein translocase subunit SecE [Ktedonobacteraceae bacterium]